MGFAPKWFFLGGEVDAVAPCSPHSEVRLKNSRQLKAKYRFSQILQRAWFGMETGFLQLVDFSTTIQPGEPDGKDRR